MQRCPRERETRFLQFTIQRPGDFIFTPIFSLMPLKFGYWFVENFIKMGRCYYYYRSMNCMWNFGWVYFRGGCVVVSGAKFSGRKVCPHCWNGSFLLQQALQESEQKLQKHWNSREQHCFSLLLSSYIEEDVTRNVKSNRVPLYSQLKSIARINGLIFQGSLRKKSFLSVLSWALQRLRVSIFYNFQQPLIKRLFNNLDEC